jgi:hypothetical protein
MDQVKYHNECFSSLFRDSDQRQRRVKLFLRESSPSGRLLLAASTVQGALGTVQTIAVSVVVSAVSKPIWLVPWQVLISTSVSSFFESCVWVFLDEPWSCRPVDKMSQLKRLCHFRGWSLVKSRKSYTWCRGFISSGTELCPCPPNSDFRSSSASAPTINSEQKKDIKSIFLHQLYLIQSSQINLNSIDSKCNLFD